MNKEKYNQIMMEAYRQYSEMSARKLFKSNTYQEFINKCKTDPEFSETWGLKIEERELSDEERNKIRDIRYLQNNLYQSLKGNDTKIDWENIPTKLITLTYNNETIEVFH